MPSCELFDTLMRAAAGVAFPAAVSVFLLTKMEGAIGKLTDQLHSLEIVIDSGFRRRDSDTKGS